MRHNDYTNYPWLELECFVFWSPHGYHFSLAVGVGTFWNILYNKPPSAFELPEDPFDAMFGKNDFGIGLGMDHLLSIALAVIGVLAMDLIYGVFYEILEMYGESHNYVI